MIVRLILQLGRKTNQHCAFSAARFTVRPQQQKRSVGADFSNNVRIWAVFAERLERVFVSEAGTGKLPAAILIPDQTVIIPARRIKVLPRAFELSPRSSLSSSSLIES